MAYKLIDISAAAIPDGGLYHLEGREDGQTCVLEGDVEGEGRLVDCFNTVEDAESYLSTLVEEVIEYAAEEVVLEEEEPVADTPVVNVTVNGPVSDPAETAAKIAEALQAHAEPAAPPASHFTKPPLSQLERFVTVTDDGRIYGHYAGPEDCHIGYLDACVPAPLTDTSLAVWSVGTVKTADGSLVETGPLALRFGHAETAGVSVADAKAHYDDPDSGIADIVVGIDEHGGWFSGAIRPGVSPEDVRKVLASGVSGDWRFIDGELRLIGICSVNRPGFTKVSLAASADGQIEALVAAGGPPLPHPSLCGCADMTNDLMDELDYLHRLVIDAGIEDSVIASLSSRIPADEAELDELAARIDA